jgi:hypothetical protein
VTEEAERVTLAQLVEHQQQLLEELRGLREEQHGMRDDQTVMIRLLQRREAELDVMRALDERYQSLRQEVERLKQRIAKLET